MKRGYRKEPIKCYVCGKLILNAYGSRKYCDDCRKKIRRQYDSKHHDSSKDEYDAVISNLKTKKEARRDRPSMTIEEVVKETEKEGLTYGKYVAKYGLY